MIRNRQLVLYEDCIAFWQSMGIQKEDNLIALSSLDVMNVFKENTLSSYKIPFYIERGRELVRELIKPKYNKNHGLAGFLKGRGF